LREMLLASAAPADRCACMRERLCCHAEVRVC
jgi:hypothetical protein